MPDATIYDTVPYRSTARTASYIDRIASLGRLLGMRNAHPNSSRVLELGCGDGGNLIPMALSLPGGEFVGIDLAPTAIERGTQAAAQTGATNVSLRQGDIASIGDELGEFDYVIAHGVYSWVPAPVRTALLRLVRARMHPHGLAFISYNALPGDHIRGVVRQMMRMHTSGIDDPRKKLEQARALLQLLAEAPGDAGDVYRPLLRSEVGRAMQASDELLFHDDLADISQPFFVTEFVAAARSAGLQFASEATYHSMNINRLPPEQVKLLADLGSRDLIAKEQYLDFLTCRGFRQTLLCHQEIELQRDVDLERLAQFRFFCEATRAEPAADQPGVTFRHRNGSALRTDHDQGIRAIDALIAANPRSIPFWELAARAGADSAESREALANILLQSFSVGVTELRLHEPSIAVTVSERPEASAWARHVATTGRAANAYHEIIELDEPARKLLPLADGSRTVSELAGRAAIDESAAATSLHELAHLGLLVA